MMWVARALRNSSMLGVGMLIKRAIQVGGWCIWSVVLPHSTAGCTGIKAVPA